MSRTASRSAASVVANWRDRQHERSWAEPARSMKPSDLTDRTAAAWAEVAKEADGQADHLVSIGFLPSHPNIRDLRQVASDAAHRAQRAIAWAGDLRLAEGQ